MIYLIEGIDRLGKSTLIDGIQQKFGYHQVIHYEKPKLLKAYEDKENPLQAYQEESFRTMFRLIDSMSIYEMIFDRAHLGEMVYAPMYRKYNGDYVLELERQYGVQRCAYAKLILLTEDFSISKHFQDDGLSLGPESARAKEQELFVDAFHRSQFKNKQIVCVTGKDGNFRPKEDILADVLS